jgi:hypothetical protein
MACEIDLLTDAASHAQTVVEKATNQTWELEELWEAKTVGRWGQEDELLPAEGLMGVSGPFPGCLQRCGATEEFEHYRLIGQSRHFLVFERPQK